MKAKMKTSGSKARPGGAVSSGRRTAAVIRTLFRRKSGAGKSARMPGARPLGFRDILLPVSLVGGFCGLIAGMVPPTVWTLLFGTCFAPLYAPLPILIYCGVRLFRGYRGKRGILVTGALSLLGLYLTVLSCQAASMTLRLHMPIFNVPVLTLLLVAKPDGLPGSLLSSAYIYPLVFTTLGFLIARELFLSGKPARFDLPAKEDIPSAQTGL